MKATWGGAAFKPLAGNYITSEFLLTVVSKLLLITDLKFVYLIVWILWIIKAGTADKNTEKVWLMPALFRWFLLAEAVKTRTDSQYVSLYY